MEVKDEKDVGIDIVPVTFPKIPPQDNVGVYFESKMADEKLKVLLPWDVARVNPSMDLIWALVQLEALEIKLNLQRENYSERREVLDHEWQDLINKEESLKKSFIMFHRFVKENQEKKERARRRINEEMFIYERRNEEIETVFNKMKKMNTVCNSLELSVEKLKMYEDYLSDVVQISPVYKSVTSVLNRYDALSAARNDLVSKQKESLEELEAERINMMLLTEEHVGMLMGLNNRLADLQVRYERAKNQSLYWESVVYKLRSRSSKELLKKYLVENSIWNLYKQMCLRKGEPPEISKKHIEDQLQYIRNTIREYKRINRIALRRTVRADYRSSIKFDTPKS